MKEAPRKRLAVIRTCIGGVWKTVTFEPMPQRRTLQ